MSDVFISYRRADERRVGELVEKLRADGLNVWWDRDIPASAAWEASIEAALHRAKAVITCWSREAVLSENVRAEARWAKEQDKLLQVYIEPCTPPLFFSEQQAINLADIDPIEGPRYVAVREAANALVRGERVANITEFLNYDRTETQDRTAKAAPWEASQFGLTLVMVLFPIAAALAVLYYFADLNKTPTPVEWWQMLGQLGFTAFILVPFGFLFGGWIAYALIARRPARVGIFSGTLLAILSAGIGCLLPFGISLIFQAPPSEETSLETLRVWEARGAFFTFGWMFLIAGALVTRVWTPIFLAFLRRRLTRLRTRLWVRAIAVATPILLGIGALFGGFPLGQMDENAEEAHQRIRRNGLAAIEDGNNYAFVRPETIRRVQTDLGLPATGQADAELFTALLALPMKSEWVLAADGSGDARTLEELAVRTHGDVTVRVLPGIYTVAETDGRFSDPVMEMIRSHDECDKIFCRDGFVRLTGDGPREAIIIEMSGAPLGEGSAITGVTLRLPQALTPTSNPAYRAAREAANAARVAGGHRPFEMSAINYEADRVVNVGPGATLADSLVLAGADNDHAVGIIGGYSGEGSGARAIVRGNRIVSRYPGLDVEPDVHADVFDNIFQTERGNCIPMSGADVAYRNNSLPACTP